MAIAFKATCALNAFTLQYVNSQCQHDNLSIKLAAKLHTLGELTKFLPNYLGIILGMIYYDVIRPLP